MRFIRKNHRRWGDTYNRLTHTGAVWTLFGLPIFRTKRRVRGA